MTQDEPFAAPPSAEPVRPGADNARRQESRQEAAPRKRLSPAAQRALAEAEERRNATQAARRAPATELHGRGGLDPARYGDWEVNGVISDF